MTEVLLVKAALEPGGNGINVFEFTYDAHAFGVFAEIKVRENIKGDDLATAEQHARQKLEAFFTGYKPRT